MQKPSSSREQRKIVDSFVSCIQIGDVQFYYLVLVPKYIKLARIFHQHGLNTDESRKSNGHGWLHIAHLVIRNNSDAIFHASNFERRSKIFDFDKIRSDRRTKNCKPENL